MEALRNENQKEDGEGIKQLTPFLVENAEIIGVDRKPFILNFLEYREGYNSSPTTSGTYDDIDSADTD